MPGRVGASPLGVWFIGKVISPLQRGIYRLTGGKASIPGLASSVVLLLTTTGRRTGRPRTVPLFYLREGNRLVVCNVNPGFERTNPWVLNLRATPRASVQVGGDTGLYRAREATESEVSRFWPILVHLWPAYQVHLQRGGKRTLFVLEPQAALAGEHRPTMQRP
jgi:deazaflavin-dependent oxidoreductase (nitroreductase family)